MSQGKMRFAGRMITRGYSPKYYDIPLVLECLKDEQLKLVEIKQMKKVKYSDYPIVVLKGDNNLLRSFEATYEDRYRRQLQKENPAITPDELKQAMPEYKINADLSK